MNTKNLTRGVMTAPLLRLFLLARFFFGGVLLGQVLAGRVPDETGMELQQYLEDYIRLGGEPSARTAISAAVQYFRYPLLAFALGFASIGVVLLPLSVPILAVVFILSFIAAITEVPVASLLLRDVNSYTLAVGMQQYLNPQNYLWGDFAAAAVLSAIPITVVFLLAQRWLVNGLTAGGVKG